MKRHLIALGYAVLLPVASTVVAVTVAAAAAGLVTHRTRTGH